MRACSLPPPQTILGPSKPVSELGRVLLPRLGAPVAQVPLALPRCPFPSLAEAKCFCAHRLLVNHLSGGLRQRFPAKGFFCQPSTVLLLP